MKKIFLLLLLLPYLSFSQSLVKTYYDPLIKTKLKEVYQVKPNTPIVNGYYKSYDQYGYLLVHRNYVNNKQNGVSTSYYGAVEASLKTDKVREKCLGEISGVFNYKNNELDGIQKKYNYSKEGKRYLQFKEIYINGNQMELYEYYPNSNLALHSVYNGICTSFYENGNKYEKFTSLNGVYQGLYTFWYKSGQIKEEGNMKDGKRDGEWIIYNEDSTIESKFQFEMGNKLPTEEEKELEKKKEIEIAKKDEENRKQEELERLKYEQENKLKKERIRLENEKNALKKEIEDKLTRLEFDKKNMEKDYQVVDEVKTSILGKTVYKFEKKNLFKAYQIATNYLQSKLKNSDDNEKNKALNIDISLVKKMSLLKNKNTKDLEKELKKVEDPEQIIKILNL